MTILYPIVFETEENGAVSAYVPGLPVYSIEFFDMTGNTVTRRQLAATPVELIPTRRECGSPFTSAGIAFQTGTAGPYEVLKTAQVDATAAWFPVPSRSSWSAPVDGEGAA